MHRAVDHGPERSHKNKAPSPSVPPSNGKGLEGVPAKALDCQYRLMPRGIKKGLRNWSLRLEQAIWERKLAQTVEHN